MGKITVKGATKVSGHFLKLHFCMFEKSQGKHNSLNCDKFFRIFFINCKVYMFKASHKFNFFYMFKTVKAQEWTIFVFFKRLFFPTKCAPFHLKIDVT
jgi:hypothetical protein